MKIGFFGILALIFITLKLVGVIAWSWVWVLAPLWIPAAIAITLAIILTVISAKFESVSESAWFQALVELGKKKKS